MKTLAIIGSGDLGQQIAHYALSDNQFQKVVFFDDFAVEKTTPNGSVIGNATQIEEAFENKLFDEIVIGIGYKHLKARKDFYERFLKKIPFGKIIHSSSWIDATAIIEDGCIIYPSCSIDANVVIKANTILNIGCTIAHDTVVGSHSFLSPRVAVAGFVLIGEQCILGINSTIIDNVNIRNNTQIGGGTVVIQSIEKSGLYVGNPAKFIR
jgi:sugar O-acyltransferase (sialic acid O-acetyltransferase NeuD family)